GHERARDIGKRARGEKCYRQLRLGERLDQVSDGVPLLGVEPGGRQARAVEPAVAVDVARVDEWTLQGARAAGMDRQIGMAGELDDAARVLGGALERHVAGD